MSMEDGARRLVAFVKEREDTRWRKESNLPMDNKDGRPVWTEDPIISQWKFCNVHREDDRVSRWISNHWREPHKGDTDLWFAMVVARFINWPDTLADLGYEWMVPWSPERFLRVMAERKAAKKKVYTGAYMVRADREHPDKAAYQEAVVFTPMWEARKRLRPKEGDTLNSYHMLLGQFHGLGSFMAAQVVADLKYVWPLNRASDWHTFAASGPGSRRGLNRVLGRPYKNVWTEEDWRQWLGRLRDTIRSDLITAKVGELHSQDLQNCLCEFDKYERFRLGEGRPRSKYP